MLNKLENDIIVADAHFETVNKWSRQIILREEGEFNIEYLNYMKSVKSPDGNFLRTFFYYKEKLVGFNMISFDKDGSSIFTLYELPTQNV